MVRATTPAAIPLWQDRAGRVLMVLSSLSAVGAFITGLSAMRSAAGDRLWVETWRTLGFLVFAGLFAVLSWRPRGSAGIWELVIANKVLLAALGFIYGSSESISAASFDAGLSVLLIAAYLLSRGWRAWGKGAWASEGVSDAR